VRHNIFNDLLQKGFDLGAAYQAFRDAMAELDDEASRPEEALALPESEDLAPEYSCEDFPMMKSFNIWDLDPEDPAFLSGKEIGLPEDVTVHSNHNQGKLFPIENGLFKSRGY